MTHDEIKAYLRGMFSHRKSYDGTNSWRPLPRVTCTDGFSVSIQGSEFVYCTPRTNAKFYTHFELGFPSEHCPTLDPYQDGTDDPLESVYAYVPLDVIVDLIHSHGGPTE